MPPSPLHKSLNYYSVTLRHFESIDRPLLKTVKNLTPGGSKGRRNCASDPLAKVGSIVATVRPERSNIAHVTSFDGADAGTTILSMVLFRETILACNDTSGLSRNPFLTAVPGPMVTVPVIGNFPEYTASVLFAEL
jgi:hypothetical protein